MVNLGQHPTPDDGHRFLKDGFFEKPIQKATLTLTLSPDDDDGGGSVFYIPFNIKSY